jgi:hypothetical protein
MALGRPAGGIACIEFAPDSLEVLEIALERGLQPRIRREPSRDLVEGLSPFGRIQSTRENIAVTGIDARPERRRGRLIERAGHDIDVEAERRRLRSGGSGRLLWSSRLLFVARGTREEIPERPTLAAAIGWNRTRQL